MENEFEDELDIQSEIEKDTVKEKKSRKVAVDTPVILIAIVLFVLMFMMCVYFAYLFGKYNERQKNISRTEEQSGISQMQADAEDIIEELTEEPTTEEPTEEPTTEEPTTEPIFIYESDIYDTISAAAGFTARTYTYHSSEVYEFYRDAWGMKVPLTTNMFIFSFDGAIDVDIDFGEIQIAVDNDEKTVLISVPDAEIISHTVDENSFEFKDAKDDVFSSLDYSDYSDMLSEQKKEQERRLLQNYDFFYSVKINAQTIFGEFLGCRDDLSEYEIIFE
ncbi:MAG: DUF4230 domain-containing protein [Ruminococcus sp.]|nr:DUF4230 domain-containing protein [Ruminococcus sp.]